MDYTYQQIAKMIDHSLLNPHLTDAELEAGCRLAREYDVASACIKPYFLKRCAEILAGSSVAASTVIGFPHGSNLTAIKLAEADQALRDGGTELDMVVNIGRVLSEDWAYVSQDIQAVVEAAHQAGAIVKVIFENCYLQDKHKIQLCEICAGSRRGFCQDLDGIRNRRRHAGRSPVDARESAGPHSGQGRRRRVYAGRAARSPVPRRRQGGRDANGEDAGRMQATAGAP